MSRFTYDHEKLSYSKVGRNLRHKFLKFFAYITASLTIAIILNIIYAFFFDTPQERQVKQENSSFIQDYNFLKKRFNQVDTVLNNLMDLDENIYRMIFESDPLRPSGIAYTDREPGYYFQFMEERNEVLIVETVNILDDIFRDIKTHSYEYQNLMDLAVSRHEILGYIPAIQPIANEELIKAASGFGYRIHPIYKIKKFHAGMDFTAPVGTPVMATGDGIVEDVVNTGRGNGKTIIINHNFGYKSSYSHLNSFNVKKEQVVKRGSIIGSVGNTGLSVAPHLHYEVLLNGNPVNPLNYFFLELTPIQYNKMIKLSTRSGQSFD